MIIIHKAMRLIVRGLAAGRLQTISSGVEHIPQEGPVLIIARHYHHFYDGLALFAALERPFHIVVALDWVGDRFTRNVLELATWIARWPVLLRGDSPMTGAFSRKELRRYQQRALRHSVELLIQGQMVVIFPEGYPNIDPHYTPKTKLDEFLPFKPGFVSIAAAAEKHLHREIPIIPAGFHYTLGKSKVAHLNFGKPIYRKEHGAARELVSCLETTVRQLSGV